VSPYFIATVYAGLDDKDQKFSWLEKAFDERYPYLILIKLEPVFDKVRAFRPALCGPDETHRLAVICFVLFRVTSWIMS